MQCCVCFFFQLKIHYTFNLRLFTIVPFFPPAVGAPKFAYYGQGTGSILFERVSCTGSEARLLDCGVDRVHTCGHWQDAGAVCSGRHKSRGGSRNMERVVR